METFKQYLAVGVAGFLGAIARLIVGRVCGRAFATNFPVGTMVINLSGSLFLGWFLAFAGSRTNINETLRIAIAVGFVGAYTTFSTYMYESAKLLETGAILMAMANVIGSVVLGLVAVFAGIWLGSR
ncbi:MAG TPA: fluoride efflux transporter CrcB [Tepidisphaeraceae bacterium]|jgi:CrcB protein